MKDLNEFLQLAASDRARPAATPAPAAHGPVPSPAPEPAPEPAPMAPESFVGRFVALHGLERADWNGTVGFVRRVEHGRCVAKLWDNSIKSIQTGNLTLIDQPDFAWACRGCPNACYRMCPKEGRMDRKVKRQTATFNLSALQ